MSSTHTDLANPEPFDILKLLDDHEQLHQRLWAADGADLDAFDATGNDIDVQMHQITIKLGSKRTVQLIHLALELARDGLGWRTESQLEPEDQERVRRELRHFLFSFVALEPEETFS